MRLLHHSTLTKEMILEDLGVIFSVARSENVLLGVHSCDAADWSILFKSGLDILSLDAYRFGESLLCYAPAMANFLDGGGVVAWGIVPTEEIAFEVEAGSLVERLQAFWLELSRHGVDQRLLSVRSMITPACGTGLLSPELADRIYSLTAEVSAAVGRMTRIGGCA